MTKAKRTRRPGAGRPPTGPAGELVSRYPPLTVRIPDDTKHRLEALSALRRVPMWKLVNEALRAYVERLPAEERRLLAQFSARMAPTE